MMIGMDLESRPLTDVLDTLYAEIRHQTELVNTYGKPVDDQAVVSCSIMIDRCMMKLQNHCNPSTLQEYLDTIEQSIHMNMDGLQPGDDSGYYENKLSALYHALADDEPEDLIEIEDEEEGCVA